MVIFVHTLAVICGIAGVVGVSIGGVLLFVPARLLRERTWFWRWLVGIDLVTLANWRRTIERPLYRHHRAFGVVVMAGAIALLVSLWELSANSFAERALRVTLGTWGMWIVTLASWVTGLFALVIGVFLFIRPSALKRVEAAANIWIDPLGSGYDRSVLPKEDPVSRFVARAPRLVALLLLAAGVACLLAIPASY